MKYNHFYRRFGACALAAVLGLSGLPVSSAVQTADSTQRLFAPVSGQLADAQPAYAADDRVQIIVELADQPLLDDGRLQQYATASEFLDSAAAQSAEAKIASAQKAVTRAMNASGMDITVERQYSAVMNGLSVEANYGDLQTIQNLKGVKDAFVAETHELVKPVDNQPLLSGSVPSIGADVAQQTGYTGKGTAVAILDTGLDINHVAFQGTVNSPKYDKSDITDILNTKKLTVGKLNADSLYQNQKVPYAFDYANEDTNVYPTQSHGTHVAGIVGANSGGTVEGVAPDAQLLIMKVFGDASNGASDVDILAALDDSVKLGADAINMSLGSDCGFSEAASKSMRAVYQRVADAGINLMVAAGNSYSSTKDNNFGNDLPLNTNPDNSMVASPSTYAAAVSVASMNNAQATGDYLIAGDRHIRYDDPAEDASKQIASLESTFEYVDCGVGAVADFPSSLTGKVALIERGGSDGDTLLSFAQKEKNAAAKGAKAVIIYDNVEGDLVSMATDGKIPAIFISKADGAYLKSLADKKVSFSVSYVESYHDAYSGQMSDFSSWGVTPDLKLKPEITAPGGNIYSTLPGNRYGNMSGTSMACPHMAGAAAIMEQYINEKQDGLSMSANDRTALANGLMMSTASPITQPNSTVPYSPRKQGAGLVQLENATQSKAYLTSQNGGLPKAEMGDSTSGAYSFTFSAHNLSADAITYEVNVRVMTESTTEENGRTFIAQSDRLLTSDEVSVNAPATVSLAANGKTDIPVAIQLTQEGRQTLNSQFPNGIFIEGYVTLTPINGGDSVALNLPFVGYYGDWAAIPLFDATAYDGETPAMTSLKIGQFRNSDGGGYILGQNLYSDSLIYNKNHIAIQGGDKSKNVTAVLSLLRAADSIEFSVTDSSGDTVYSETSKNVCKTYYSSAEMAFYTPMADKGFRAVDDWNDVLPDGQYTYHVTGSIGGKEQKLSFPLTIDSEKPQVLKSEIVTENGKRLWKVTVSDNHYVQAVCATLGSSPLNGWQIPQETEAGAQSVITFDLTDDALRNLPSASIALIDYAGNTLVTEPYSLTGGSSEVLPTSVELNKTQLSMTAGDVSALSATVKPDNATDKTVTWTSSNDKIVSVDKNGKLTALAQGMATITAMTINGKTASCAVTVAAKADPAPSTVLASIHAPSTVQPGESVPVDFQLEKMQRVATVSFTFEKDASLTDAKLTGMNGFTALDGIQWKSDNTGVMMLSYLKQGAGGSLTGDALTDIARVTFAASEQEGAAGIRMTSVTVSGYDATGKAVYLSSSIKTASASVTVRKGVSYDVNGDGKVDQLDITACQLYYQAKQGDSNWSTASKADLNQDGKVDVEDMVLILHAIYAL